MILLVSGFCSLVYQVVWIREFRLIFGGTTGAMATVLAVFMGGLGFGGVWFGSRIERVRAPLRYYGQIELGIGLTAAASPVLMMMVKPVYLMTGGEFGLGYGATTLLRVAMAVVVIGLPCFLMGGTLPAVAKTLQTGADHERKITGWLYGVNIAGAVLGVLLATFVMLEFLGSRGTLWVAAAANLVIGGWVFLLRRERVTVKVVSRAKSDVTGVAVAASSGGAEPGAAGAEAEEVEDAKPMRRWCYGAAFATGFIFFVLELVWYRMAVPLVGGSVYSLGLVLAQALGGMALGGIIYSLWGRTLGRRRDLFALVSALQVVAILLPYLLGDWFAWGADLVIGLTRHGFFGLTLSGLSFIILGLVLLPSILAGLQFPMLLSLLGDGSERVGRQIGRAYGWNTFGAIAGSLTGGFVLMPWWGAPTLWWLCGLMAALVSVAFLWLASRGGGRVFWLGKTPVVALTVIAVTLIACLVMPGPGAFWRHTAIGFGGAPSTGTGLAQVLGHFSAAEEAILGDWDGRENNVAVSVGETVALMTNGKSDSSVSGDISTTIGIAALPLALHPEPVETVAVIGMGTGITAGWAAAMPEVKRVDVFEMEPAVVKAQRFFARANLQMLKNPKVKVQIGDARESLAARGAGYDLVLSEPSNLFRAGICDLYTADFYRQCAGRMKGGALFAQWVQAYSISVGELLQVGKTLRAVFPRVELWQTKLGDVLFVCSFEEGKYDGEAIESRLEEPVLKEALVRAFRSDSTEGLFARMILDSAALEEEVAGVGAENTDDRNTLEFRIARSVFRDGGTAAFLGILHTQLEVGHVFSGVLDAERLVEERLMFYLEGERSMLPPFEGLPAWMVGAVGRYGRLDFEGFLAQWREEPKTLRGRLMVATARAYLPGEDAGGDTGMLSTMLPVEAALLQTANDLLSANRPLDAYLERLDEVLKLERERGWCDPTTMAMTFVCAGNVVAYLTETQMERAFEVFEKPLSDSLVEGRRKELLLLLARRLDDGYKRRALAACGDAYPKTADWLSLAALISGNREAKRELNRYQLLGLQSPPWAGNAGGFGPGFLDEKARSARVLLAPTRAGEPWRR